MVSPLYVASRLTLGSCYEISGTVKLWVPPQHSWGVSYVALGEPGVRSWHALDILSAIAKVNNEFYPVPTKNGPRDEHGAIQIVEKRGDFLTLEKFVTLYNACGEVLHTRNPFARKPAVRVETREDCERLLKAADRWQSRIVRLLTHHTFKVKGDDTLYIAHTVGEERVFHVTEFAPVSELGRKEKLQAGS